MPAGERFGGWPFVGLTDADRAKVKAIVAEAAAAQAPPWSGGYLGATIDALLATGKFPEPVPGIPLPPSALEHAARAALPPDDPDGLRWNTGEFALPTTHELLGIWTGIGAMTPVAGEVKWELPGEGTYSEKLKQLMADVAIGRREARQERAETREAVEAAFDLAGFGDGTRAAKKRAAAAEEIRKAEGGGGG